MLQPPKGRLQEGSCYLALVVQPALLDVLADLLDVVFHVLAVGEAVGQLAGGQGGGALLQQAAQGHLGVLGKVHFVSSESSQAGWWASVITST